MTVNEFLRFTRTIKPSGGLDGRPMVECFDGFRVSIQASDLHYCVPQTNDDVAFEAVELGCPNEYEEDLMPFAEDPDDPTESVYAYVPVSLVDDLLKKHGGIMGIITIASKTNHIIGKPKKLLKEEIKMEEKKNVEVEVVTEETRSEGSDWEDVDVINLEPSPGPSKGFLTLVGGLVIGAGAAAYGLWRHHKKKKADAKIQVEDLDDEDYYEYEDFDEDLDEPVKAESADEKSKENPDKKKG